jgi:class 3 adenylate cyclase
MPRPGDRFVATVMFADVVGSTELAVRVGDRAWNAILGIYYETARREVRRCRGREIDTAGDGFFAAFDTPNDGVRAAAAIVQSMWARGIPVRAGLHTGECEVIERKVGGIAVHIGARVAGLAGAGEIVVTSTVRELTAGSAVRYKLLGTRELKGVPGEWSVYAVASDGPRPALPPIDVPRPDDPGNRGRRRAVAIAAVLVAVAAVTVVVALRNGSQRPVAAPSGSGPTTVGPSGSPPGSPRVGGPFLGLVAISAQTGRETVLVPIDLTTNPDVSGHDVTSGFGFVWVADFSGQEIYKVNPDTGTVVATIPIAYPVSLVVRDVDVWVASGSEARACDACNLIRVDASRNAQADSMKMAACCGGVAIDGTFLWVLGTNELSRVDLETGKARSFPVGGDAIAVGGGKVWILSRALATLTPVDGRTGAPEPSIALEATSPTMVAYGFDALWVTDRSENEVTRIPVDGRGGTDAVAVGDEPVGLIADQDAVWVANAGDGTVSRIDPFEAAVQDTYQVGGRPERITVAFGSVWVAAVPQPKGTA